MRIKRSAGVLFCLFLLAGSVFAGSQYKIDAGPLGDPYYFWLETCRDDPSLASTESTLKFLSSSLPEPQTLYSFSREVNACDIEADNTKFNIVYSSGNRVYLTSSRDNGNTFSEPLVLTDRGSNPCAAIQGDLLLAAWEENDAICYRKWEEGSINYDMIETLLITGEALSSPALSIDDQGQAHLILSSKDGNTQINGILYTSLASPEPMVLFESHDELVNVGINAYGQHLFVFWQEKYLQRKGSYFSISLDGGRTFCQPKSFELSSDLISLILRDRKLLALFHEDPLILEAGMVSDVPGIDLKSKEIELPAPAVPEIVLPAPGAVLNLSDLKLRYLRSGSDPFICGIELSEEKGSNSWSLEQIVTSGTQNNVDYSFPMELADGDYLLKIYFSDGISQGPVSPTVRFRVDSAPPLLQTCEAQRREKELILKGRIGEFPVWLAINGQGVTLESSSEAAGVGIFEKYFSLSPGKNLFTLAMSDEAGNLSIATREVFYDPAVPEIAMLSPNENEWFKPGSVIVIEARVSDVQGDIQDGTEAQITIDGKRLEGTLPYDAEQNSLFGFVCLPADLIDGVHKGTVALPDSSGNKGVAEFNINIDGSPPLAQITPGDPFFSGSQTSIPLPVKDEGAGVDAAGTLITVSGASLEGKISIEAEDVVWIPSLSVPEGTYEVEISARDQIGNVAEAVVFCLVVDTTAPVLTLIGTYEPITAENKITIQGKVIEKNPQTINIYNNKEKVRSFELTGDCFSYELDLLPGNNDICVEVMDRSGNKAEEKVCTFATFSPFASGLIQSCANGPNPFSPGQSLPGALSASEKGMLFSYSLAQPADVRILIFDLTGTLIWSKEMKSTSSGVTAWSGVDAFGRVAQNGIYPYVFSATSNGRTEIRRGKIIVYQ